MPEIPVNGYQPLDPAKDQFLEQLRDGVFASMDLPPLFPYIQHDHKFCEDGGVIDNLPLYFGTAVEACDLLFVLPLNASFEIFDVNTTSIVERLYRVLDMRQGELERRGFRETYLYNQQVALKNVLRACCKVDLGRPSCPREEQIQAWIDKKLKEIETEKPELVGEKGLNSAEWKVVLRALARELHYTKIFAITPNNPLVIDTAQFWNRDGAREAFDLMYDATRTQLQRMDFTATQEFITMYKVSRAGEIDLHTQF